MEKLDKMKFLELFHEMSSEDFNYPDVHNENAAFKNMSRPERMTARDIRRFSFECRKLSALVGSWAEYKIGYQGEQLETVAYMLKLVSLFLSFNVYYEFLTTFDPENPDSKYAL